MSKHIDIMPPRAASLNTLTATMAIMCYLACLAVGALILIDRAVDTWAKGLSQELTVQIREVSSSNIEADVAAAKELLAGFSGVVSVDDLGKDAGMALLEPWLGKEGLAELPIPRLLKLRIGTMDDAGLEVMSAALMARLPHASLDTHRRWEAELTRMAGTLSLLSMLVLALIGASTIAMVVSASRAVLESNRSIVDVLQLVGAENRFIARQMDKRFLATGLWAGLLGIILALATFYGLSRTGLGGAHGLAQATRSLFYVPTPDSWWAYGYLLAVPVAATALALLTSRLALLRMLRG